MNFKTITVSAQEEYKIIEVMEKRVYLTVTEIFKEEITLYRLHKSNISVLNQSVSENELFISEIKQQIEFLLDNNNNNSNNSSNDNGKDQKLTSFKRIVSRFFHQNEIFKSQTQQKISEINETIEKKNRQLERMNIEIESWNNKEDS